MRKLFYLLATLLFLVIMTLLNGIFFGDYSYNKKSLLIDENNLQIKKNNNLKKENDILEFEIDNAQKSNDHIENFAKAGSDIITIHYEATTHIDSVLTKIKSLGKKAGISIVPSTNEDVLDYILDKVDLILVMTVNPGFGGQRFLESQIKKIENIRQKIDNCGKKILLQIDGGINDKTAKIATKAGADILVSGSYIFNHHDYQERINNLLQDD